MAGKTDIRLALLEVGREAMQAKVKGALSQRADKALQAPQFWFSTGSKSLDRLCRGFNPGGLPSSRMIHIAGKWSTGKSLLLDHIFLDCQHQGGLCICSESEGTRDAHFANAIGLDLSMLEIQRPDTIEEMVDAGIAWHRAIRAKPGGKHIPIVWGMDSLDSTESAKASEKGLSEGGGWKMGGGRSEALGAGLRKIAKEVALYPTTLVMLNQTRDNVGQMFGPQEVTSIGNPPHFYASIEIMLRPAPGLAPVRAPVGAPLKLTSEAKKRLGIPATEVGNIIGRWVQATVSKSKVAPTYQQTALFFMDFQKGVHEWGGLLQTMIRDRAIEPSPDAKQVTDGGVLYETVPEWLAYLKQNPDRLGPQSANYIRTEAIEAAKEKAVASITLKAATKEEAALEED